MPKFLLFFFIIFLSSCSSTKKITIENLKTKYRLYGLRGNSYFYFMTDSAGGPYLVRTHFMNPEKIIWIEKLEKR